VLGQVRGRDGGRPAGGIVGYPLEQLHEEVAFLAYYFHWSLEEIMELQHSDRRGFIEEISSINRKLRDEAAGVTTNEGVWATT
jgi:hypothetical protein